MYVSPTTVTLTRAWYAWERRGRGVDGYEYPVPVEPPFGFFDPPRASAPVDDGRHPTWLSGLFKRRRPALPPEEPAIEQPDVWSGIDNPTEFRLCAPAGSARGRSLPSLVRAVAPAAPLAVEWVGFGDRVELRLACFERSAPILEQAVRALMPDAVLEPVAPLIADWPRDVAGEAAVEFGLGREFVVPLPSGGDSATVALLVDALAAVEEDEAAVVQLLVDEVRAPWDRAILAATATPTGAPFFADAPEVTNLAREKCSSLLFACGLRCAVRAVSDERAWDLVRRIAAAVTHEHSPGRNELVPLAADEVADIEADILLRRTFRSGMILSESEVGLLARVPDGSIVERKLVRHAERTEPAPAICRRGGVLLGVNRHRGVETPVRLPPDARFRHVHVVGASGTGKSTLLLAMILQDIEEGHGLAVVDPHGDLVDGVLARCPDARASDVVLVDPSDEEHVTGWNLLRASSELDKELLADDLVAAIRRQATSWGDQMTAVLSQAVLAVLSHPMGGTLLDLRMFLLDARFRESFLAEVRDEYLRDFWRHEFPLLIGRRPQTPILTRLSAFLRSRGVRETVTAHPGLDIAALVRERKVLLARLAQGAIGRENAALLGSLLVASIHQATLARSRESDRSDFFLYLDEFHDVATPSMAALFSGARKFRLGVVAAHQDLSQLRAAGPELERAVLANAHTRVCFRVGEDDSRVLSRGFGRFDEADLTALRTGHAIARVGERGSECNVRVPPLPHLDPAAVRERREALRQMSFARYGSRRVVEQSVPEEPCTVPPQVPAAEEPKTPPPRIPVEKREPTVPPTSPGRSRMSAAAGQHRYLQEVIRGWGHEHGYRATVEHELPEGGRVDVLLERGEETLGCEIAVTTTLEHEVENVRKCLRAGLGTVALVSTRAGFLTKLKSRLERELSAEDLARVEVCSPEGLFGLVSSQPLARERTTAGYRVRVEFARPGGAGEQERRIAEVLAKGLKRLGRVP